MRRTLAALAGLTVAVGLTASAAITITLDERGQGLWDQDGEITTFTGVLMTDPTGGLLRSVLVYTLNTNFYAGDVVLNEPDEGVSDVIRFVGGNQIVFYCSDTDGTSLADTGLPPLNWVPSSPYRSSDPDDWRVDVTEIMGEGGQTGYWPYVPGDWGPGYYTGSREQITFIFLSDIEVIPEPGTVIAGALLLLPFGASLIRRLRKA